MGKKIVVDDETGEIISQIETGDKIVRKKSIEYLNCSMEFNAMDFIKLNTKEFQLIVKELNNYEKIFILSAIPYISYNTCKLQLDNKTDVNTEKLIEIVNISRTKFYSVINGLKEKKIIYSKRSSTGAKYYINPWIIYKGNRINKDLKMMFSDYKIKHLQKEWRDL